MSTVRKGSSVDIMLGMEVGEVVYYPTTGEKYQQDMGKFVTRRNNTRHPELADRRFSTSLWTAVRAQDVRYLLAVERTQ